MVTAALRNRRRFGRIQRPYGFSGRGAPAGAPAGKE